MKLQILGSGCPTCNKLHQAVQQVVQELDLKAEAEYLSGPMGTQKIIELGLMKSPVLVIDGQVAQTGFNNDLEQLKEFIQEKLEGEG